MHTGLHSGMHAGMHGGMHLGGLIVPLPCAMQSGIVRGQRLVGISDPVRDSEVRSVTL